MDPNLIADTNSRMRKAMDVLTNDLATIRTGRAAPSLVENIMVSVYNGTTQLRVMEVATINASDPQTLVLTPFDASITEEIRKGIAEANAGGSVEKTDDVMKQKLENGKIMIRQVRHEAMADLKKGDLPEDEDSRLEKEIQHFTDEFIEQIGALGKKKEEELMQI